jgi:hypothetical protein
MRKKILAQNDAVLIRLTSFCRALNDLPVARRVASIAARPDDMQSLTSIP